MLLEDKTISFDVPQMEQIKKLTSPSLFCSLYFLGGRKKNLVLGSIVLKRLERHHLKAANY